MRNTHSKMSVKHRMDPRHCGEFCESLVNACHKMLNNPCTTWSIEVLGFDKIKFCQGRKANTFCLKVHFGEPEDELLLLPNRKQVIYPQNRVFRGERVRRHAKQVVRRQKRLSQATTKDSPSFGLSHWCSFLQFVVALVPYFIPFAENYIKNEPIFKEANCMEVPQFFWGWRGTPEPSTVHALAARKKKSPLLNDLRYNAKC